MNITLLYFYFFDVIAFYFLGVITGYLLLRNESKLIKITIIGIISVLVCIFLVYIHCQAATQVWSHLVNGASY